MKPNEKPKAETDAKEELSLDELDKASGGVPSTSNQPTYAFRFEKINVENMNAATSAPDDWAQ
jgi:preprotein translocase subunit SecD